MTKDGEMPGLPSRLKLSPHRSHSYCNHVFSASSESWPVEPKPAPACLQTHTHTHTHTYIYIWGGAGKDQGIKQVKILGGCEEPKHVSIHTIMTKMPCV